MTLKHLAEGLMQATGSHFQSQCEELLGLPQGLLCKMQNDKQEDMMLWTFFLMAERSGLSIETMAAWCRMPKGQPLGRIAPQEIVLRTHGRVRIEKVATTSTKRVQAFRARRKELLQSAAIGKEVP